MTPFRQKFLTPFRQKLRKPKTNISASFMIPQLFEYAISTISITLIPQQTKNRMTNVFKCFYVSKYCNTYWVLVLVEFASSVVRGGGCNNAPPNIWFLLKQLNFSTFQYSELQKCQFTTRCFSQETFLANFLKLCTV